jgi:mRNA-degrading endonuclease RelE of RelBE toxin-antitoxin system
MAAKNLTAQVMRFFGMTLTEFKNEWKRLSKDEKEWFKTAVDEVMNQ